MASISKTNKRIKKSKFLKLFLKNFYFCTRQLELSRQNSLEEKSFGNAKANLSLIRSLSLHSAKKNKDLSSMASSALT